MKPFVVAALSAGVVACGRPGEPVTVDSTGPSAAFAAEVGKFHVTEIGAAAAISVVGVDSNARVVYKSLAPDSASFEWRAGATTPLPPGFVANATNDLGDIAGQWTGKAALLAKGSTTPAVLSAVDTPFPTGAVARFVNNRLEVLVGVPAGSSGVDDETGVWHAGAYRKVGGFVGIARGFNNVGGIVLTYYSSLYPITVATASPFDPAAATPSVCAGGRSSYAFALNDSSRALGAMDALASNGGFILHEMLSGVGGCADLSSRFPGKTFRVLSNAGWLGGLTLNQGSVPTDTAVLAQGARWVNIDALLLDGGWHVRSIRWITPRGDVVATASKASAADTWVLLSRVPPT